MPDDLTGLDEIEARRRLSSIGPNELEQARRRTLWAILRETSREPMFLLLLTAAALYVVIGDLREGAFLSIGAFLTVGLVVVQEARTEGAMAALRRLAQPTARVVRGGVERRIAARDLVPGDLILVGEGERLPADGVLVAGDVLAVDESMLTGESATVSKQPDPSAEFASNELPGGEAGSALFAGSLIVRGHGSVLVRLTGPRTAMGRIGRSLASIVDEPTPLQQTAGRVVRLLGASALAFCVVVALAYGLTRGDWLEAGLAGITVAIALIPEEFPMVLAVFLALGSWRLARHSVLVRRPAVVEALGGATVLCVDKTGTLTENRMAVARLWVAGAAWAPQAPEARSEPSLRLVRTAALASGRRSIDPMDRAILQLQDALRPAAAGGAAGADPLRTWPLRPERPVLVQAWSEAGGVTLAAKGAPEAVFRLCGLSSGEHEVLHRAVEAMASDGLRVLAVAHASPQGLAPERPEDAAFVLDGLLGFLDPLRTDVPAALREAREAGIAVVMITGDHPATALATARRAGLDVGAGLLTGQQIAEMPQEALQARLREVRVFARVLPEQKLKIVEALKAAGEVVAMTGDGVNDAPALEAAHIGVSMGRRGSDVAREASDLVLLDDGFASIVGAVRLGRRIFANLRRALTFITAVHVPIAGLALLPVLLGLPPLLFPMHVVLLELVIDPTCALVFEAEPSDEKAMQRPPRRRDEALFGLREISASILQGAGVLAGVLGLYAWAVPQAGEGEARGAAFVALVGADLALALVDSLASRRLFVRQHAALGLIVAGVTAVLAGVFSLPVLRELFQFSAPTGGLAAAAAGVIALSAGWAVLLRRLMAAAPRGPRSGPRASGPARR